jgi:hypothetical protein
MFLFDVPTLERRVLRTVVRTILEEYVAVAEPPAQDEAEEGPVGGIVEMLDGVGNAFSTSASAFGVSPEGVQALAGALDFLTASVSSLTDPRSREPDPAQECARYTELLAKLYNKGVVLEPHTLSTPSNSTYAESRVGIVPSTEPYSERMRSAEIALKRADIDYRQAEVAFRRGLASTPGGKAELRILQVAFEAPPRSGLKVVAAPCFTAGVWELICDGVTQAEATLSSDSPMILFLQPRGGWSSDTGRDWAVISSDGASFARLPLS